MASPVRKVDSTNIEILKDPIVLSDTFQTTGVRLDVRGIQSIVLWLDLVVGTSEGIEFKALAYNTKSDDNGYSFPTEEIFTGRNKIYPKVYEVQQLTNQKLLFQVTPANSIPYIEVFIRAEVPGGSPGSINSLMVGASVN